MSQSPNQQPHLQVVATQPPPPSGFMTKLPDIAAQIFILLLGGVISYVALNAVMQERLQRHEEDIKALKAEQEKFVTMAQYQEHRQAMKEQIGEIKDKLDDLSNGIQTILSLLANDNQKNHKRVP